MKKSDICIILGGLPTLILLTKKLKILPSSFMLTNNFPIILNKLQPKFRTLKKKCNAIIEQLG